MSQDTKFELVLSKHNVSDEMKAKLRESFSSYEAIALEWNDKIDSIVIESEEQVSEMKKAREARLFIRDKRLAVTNAIKEQKEESLRKGQALDAIKRFFLELFEPLEEKAELKEKYAQIKQEERRKAKAQERVELIKPYDATIHESTVIDMTDDVFGSYLLGVKKTYEERVEAEAKAEAERQAEILKEQLHEERKSIALPYYSYWSEFEKTLNFGDVSESDFNAFMVRIENAKRDHETQVEAQRAENEKLKREAEEAEQHRANLEAELKAKQEAEAKAEQERLVALEAELSKGDAEKFESLISDLTVLKTKYQFKSVKYRKKLADVSELIDRIVTHVKK